MKRKQILFYFFPTLLAFCLPFGGYALSYIIIGWLALSFFNLKKEKLISGIKKPQFILSLFFFIYTLISAIAFDGVEKWNSIEIKLSFAIMPYLFFCFEYPFIIIQRIIVGFVSGSFFACIILLCRGIYFAVNGQTNYLTYSDFSYFMHTAYFSLYLCLALLIINLYYPIWFKSARSLLNFSKIMGVLFTVCILLCASKIGILCLILVYGFIGFTKFKGKLTLTKGLIIFASLVVLLLATLKFVPAVYARFDNLIHLNINQLNKQSSESSEVRVLIWEQCLDIIKTNFFIGVGVGNANDTLYHYYAKYGLTGALDHKLNAHNQFFQTGIGLGILGVLPLLVLLMFGLYKTIKTNFILFVLSLLIILNFLTESMLQSAAGVLFFCFFTNLFFNFNSKTLSENKE
ncbi:MAG: O-antigen ligase family protein [Bacteroidetes bacterium]|nr:O-antigen ligase family protein [Bacteroidota bacterium]